MKKQSDKWFKWFLVLGALYVTVHTALVYADTVFTPSGTVINCIPTGTGSIVCI
jgi:hypothetical protein